MSGGRPLAALLDGASDLCRSAPPPADPFEARALADAALVLTGDLLDLVSRIHDHHQAVRRQWVTHDRDLAKLDPAGTPPPPPPPPPPTEACGPGGKGDGGGTGYPPPPPPGGGS